jgi:two-component system nitrogen regulation response regulator NtrX
LRNTIERMAILSSGTRISVEAIPIEIRAPAAVLPSALHDIRDSAERDRIQQALDETRWNVSRAARLLGIERTNLHKRIRALNLSRRT